jgi:long-subunit fatty acid transport protein
MDFDQAGIILGRFTGMKKLLVMVMTICLVFSIGSAAMAEGKTVYLEYQTEKDADNYGPTLGLDWGVGEQWTLSLSHQFQGSGANEATTSLGVEYAILKNLAAALNYDIANSENSIGLEFSGSYALSDPWALTGGAAFTAFTPKAGAGENPNYSELELSAGVEYQVTEALLMSLGYTWTHTRFDDHVIDLAEGGSAGKFVGSVEYSFGDYAVYCEYEIPEKGYTVTLGASYNF